MSLDTCSSETDAPWIKVDQTDRSIAVKLEPGAWSSGRSLTPRPSTLKKTFLKRMVVLVLSSVVGVMLLLNNSFPPSYHSARMGERALPQHRWIHNGRYIISGYPTVSAAKNSEDEGQLYVRFPDHLGERDDFSYVLQDALLKSLIAYQTNRSLVFEDVVFSWMPVPFTMWRARVPIGAFLGGWLAGQYKQEQRSSISSEYFEYACPESERVEVEYRWPWDLTSEDSPNEHADGQDVLKWWIERLNSEDIRGQKCIVIREIERRLWHPRFLESGRHLSLFSALIHSPGSQYFKWSDIVESVVQRISQNIQSIKEDPITVERHGTTSALADAQSMPESISPKSRPSMQILEGVISVHIPRAKTGRRCVIRSAQKSGYVSWNKLLDGINGRKSFQEDWETYKQIHQDEDRAGDSDDFEDDLNKADMERESKQREDYYLSRCHPTIPQIVARLRQVRSEIASSKQGKHLTKVHITTDGSLVFIKQLRQSLLADGWEQVIETGNNIHHGYSVEEEGVSAAIDMAISEKAEVFLANGFSGLSANVVMLRLSKGISSNLTFVF